MCANKENEDNLKAGLNESMCYDLADFFKNFGDPTRIKILYALLHGELCVSDLVQQLDMNQSAISHQLKTLRQNDLVKFKKEGKLAVYSLDDDHVTTLLQMGIEHIVHKNGYEEV